MSDERVEQFLAELADEGRGALTITTYRRAILAWLRAAPELPTATDVQTYLRRFPALSSRRTHLAALRRWYRHVGGLDPTQGVRVGRPPERVPRVITEEEERSIFRAARPRELAVLVLLRATGLRVGETVGYRRWHPGRVRELVAGLRVGDLDLDALMIVVRGKGNGEDLVFIDRQTADVLRWHLSTLPHSNPAAPLFQRRDGTPLGVRRINALFRRLSRRGELGRTVTPHMMRHTFLTRFLEAGGNLRAAQQLARHKKLASTLIYARFGDRALRAQYDTYAGGIAGHPGIGAVR